MSEINKVALTVFILVISGCSKIVTQKDIALAERYCEKRGGVFSIEVESEITVKYITCRNGDTVNSNKVVNHD